MADKPADSTAHPAEAGAAPTTEAIQTVQRRTWIRGISIFIGVCVLLVLLGWIAGSITNALTESPTDRTLVTLDAAPDRDAVPADAPDGVEATLAWSETLGVAAITASGLPALSGDEAFIVWYTSGDDYRYIADFRADGPAASVSALLYELWKPGETVVVSVDVPGDLDTRDVEPEALLSFATPPAPNT